MRTRAFTYHLPKEQIAQNPTDRRDASRLLVLNSGRNRILDDVFTEFPEYLKHGDVLVFNDSKVIPARLFGVKDETAAKVELLLLALPENNIASAMVGNARVVKVGTKITISENLTATALELQGDGIIRFEFHCPTDLMAEIERCGKLPLPPYITEFTGDQERYQTLYAKNLGSIAAPTAGLHFTEEIMEKMREKKVKIVYITLHVGLGTFKPVETGYLQQHKMHEEYYTISAETAITLNEAIMNSDRIIAIGTTSLRALESNYRQFGYFHPVSQKTDIFIYPPQEIKSVNMLVTNFHQPGSTLLLLVMAMGGIKFIRRAYRHAVTHQYRFLSFGDACLIFNNRFFDRRLIGDNRAFLLDVVKNEEAGIRPKLLLHTCCAPCLMQALDFLNMHYDVTVFFSNSNIDTKEEYDKRLAMVQRYIFSFNLNNVEQIKIIADPYDPNFTRTLQKYQEFPEGNFRCFGCIKARLARTYQYLRKHPSFQVFATTLTASYYKSVTMVNLLGEQVGSKNGRGRYLASNFRLSSGLYTETEEYHGVLNVYHQRYCGCNPGTLRGVGIEALQYDDFLAKHGLEDPTYDELVEREFAHLRIGKKVDEKPKTTPDFLDRMEPEEKKKYEKQSLEFLNRKEKKDS